MRYQEAGVPLVVLAGTDYGMGSSRDWAAKGTLLLGVKVVIAKSYERIHRSNLVGMGVLPLEFQGDDTYQSLGLDGSETFDFPGLSDEIEPLSTTMVQATKADGTVVKFPATVRLDTPVDVEYYRNGGILHTVIRKML
jgi:aconitate hydratase